MPLWFVPGQALQKTFRASSAGSRGLLKPLAAAAMRIMSYTFTAAGLGRMTTVDTFCISCYGHPNDSPTFSSARTTGERSRVQDCSLDSACTACCMSDTSASTSAAPLKLLRACSAAANCPLLASHLCKYMTSGKLAQDRVLRCCSQLSIVVHTCHQYRRTTFKTCHQYRQLMVWWQNLWQDLDSGKVVLSDYVFCGGLLLIANSLCKKMNRSCSGKTTGWLRPNAQR